MSQIYINGRFYPKEEARVSVFDRGFLYGDGIFETMRVYKKKIFQLDAHLDRLFASAAAIGIELPFTRKQISDTLHLALKKNTLAEALLRLTVSRGAGQPGLDTTTCREPTVVIFTYPAPAHYTEMYKDGIAVTLAKTRRVPANALNPEIKSANFLNNILAKIEAQNAGTFDALMLNQEGYLCEGTVSNIFFFKQGILKTPARPVGLLCGVTRNFVLQTARNSAIHCEEGFYNKQDLFEAEEVFLTNSGIEIMPVVKIDGQPIGDGCPGRITKQLHQLFRETTVS